MIKANRTDARGNVAETVTITARAVPQDAPPERTVVLLDIAGTKVTKHYDIALEDFTSLVRDAGLGDS